MERRPDGMIGITRGELHELVWAKPRRQVAASMGVTDFILADACRKAAVPTPSSGHWTKVSLGKVSEPIPLPPAPVGVEELVIVGKVPRLPPAVQDPKEPALPKVAIPDLLRDPHPMVAEAKASLERQAAAGDATLHWHKTGSFQIRVGPESLDRVLRFLDAVLRAVEAHGHPVSHGRWKWWVTFGEAHIGMRLEANYEEVPRKPKPDDLKWMRQSPGWRPPATEWIPTPKLALKMEGYAYGLRKAFSDGKRQSLETLAPEIVATILAIAAHRAREKVEHEESERRWAEEKERRAAIERRRREEDERVVRLKADAASWREARMLQEYIGAVRSTAGEDIDDDVARWLKWASEVADRTDPLSNGLPRRPEGLEEPAEPDTKIADNG